MDTHTGSDTMAACNPLATPERIAFAGDWHANTAWAREAIWHAQENGADVIVQLGDFGYHFRPAFLAALTDVLAVTELPLLFVEGNHENHKWLLSKPIAHNGLRPLSEWIWHIPRGFRWTWAGTRFVGLGGAHSVDGIWRRESGDLWQREERITEEQAAAVAAGGRADVLIAHDCPAGIDIPGLEPNQFPEIEILRAAEHREILRGVVDAVQPTAIWHGHYHVEHWQTVDLGYGPVTVNGLNCDGKKINANVKVVALTDLPQGIQATA